MWEDDESRKVYFCDSYIVVQLVRLPHLITIHNPCIPEKNKCKHNHFQVILSTCTILGAFETSQQKNRLPFRMTTMFGTSNSGPQEKKREFGEGKNGVSTGEKSQLIWAMVDIHLICPLEPWKNGIFAYVFGKCGKIYHTFWVYYYKSLAGKFRPFRSGFLYFSRPFGVTNRRERSL